MCYLYTCSACQMGDHEHCEKSHSTPGTFGGRCCVCRCRGRNEKQWMEDEEKERKTRNKRLFDFMDLQRKDSYTSIHIGNEKKFK